MGEKLVEANGVTLCLETFGDPADPPILLVAGAASSMDWWETGLCERLARGARHVIRYDQRDTGRSVSYPPGAPGYTGRDLVGDAIGLLDAFGVPEAHVVGMSMGGGVAQVMAVEHPERVASLVLMSTSPAGPRGPGQAELPPMSDELRQAFAEPPAEPDWSDREAVIEYVVDGDRPYRGSVSTGAADTREIAARAYDRTVSFGSSMTNHWLIEPDGDPVGPRLDEVTAPTLVIHGTEDPLFPYAHAVALAEGIPGAELLPLEGVGHQMPPREVWDVVVPAVLRHTTRGKT
jgi:pimeloyl-ACP methyl ester carboxylesterase